MDKIGNVTITRIADSPPDGPEYSDGPVEDELLAMVKRPDFTAWRQAILANNPSWPLRYHLSPVRENLVNWYEIGANSTVLEIGAGCGAITEALVKIAPKSASIHALELSVRRAQINAHRNSQARNLKIMIGNLQALQSGNVYDHVVCIGVLEYAGRFISGDNPFEQFLRYIRNALSVEGELILAIENKFGLKYLNGSREDHTGRFYDSIMSYPQYNGVRTFSRSELIKLFKNQGLVIEEFLFPVPDYKLPSAIVSENAISVLDDTSFLTRLAPAPAPDRDRVYSSSEQLITHNIIGSGLYPELANSFLIRARKAAINE